MSSYAQNSQNAGSPAVDKTKIISNLLERIDADEVLIKTLEVREKALSEEIAKADAAHAELTEAHKAALLELGELRATIKYLKAEIDGLKQQVELWRSESQRLNKELKASRKRELFLLLGLIARSVIGR
jgi:peptidoglycan hydrolase CwlO-like protein